MSQSDFVTRGQALVTAGQYQEAVKVCRLGLLGRPTTVEGRVVLGQALLALKRFDEVLAEMRVALELDHNSVPAQVLKAEALLRKGDHLAAIDVLQRVRALGAQDPRVAQLLGEAERGAGRPSVGASHPSVGFVGGPAAETMTKHYPNHGADEEDTSDNDGVEDSGGSFTRPTSVRAPESNKRSRPQPAVAVDATPPPSVLAVGDRSGTVEVDPELDGVELPGDDDFDDVIAPPASRGRAKRDPQARGQVMAAVPGPRARPKAVLPQPSPKSRPKKAQPDRREVSSVELIDDDMIEVAETMAPPSASRPRPPGPGTAVRNAVQMPSGPIGGREPERAGYAIAAGEPERGGYAIAAGEPERAGLAPPPHLAQLIANQPHVMQVNQQPARPMAAMPTLAPMQPVPGLPPVPPSSFAAAARPTLAVNAPPLPLMPGPGPGPNVVDQLFGNGDASGAPMWARATVVAGGAPPPAMAPQRIAADEPTRQAMPLDPQIAAFLDAPGSSSGSAAAMPDTNSQSGAKPLKTGVRRGRSRMQIALWVLVGAVMIGGGVVAGFRIRAMRLNRQIAAARGQAVELAKNDTWTGWLGARERLSRIAEASGTVDNRAALARTRALVAFEFGDGFADAATGVADLGDSGGLDAAVAAAYVALAQSDGKAAKAAAERAIDASSSDPAALYVTGQAALLQGDLKAALSNTKAAIEKEARPLYAVGLARAYAAGSQWDEALAALGDTLKATPDQPAALIEKARVLLDAGRIAAGAAPNSDLRVQLDRLVADGAKPPTEPNRRVSPAQAVSAGLALAELDFVRGDPGAARNEARIAVGIGVSFGVSDQRTAEQIGETLYAINLPDQSRKAVDETLAAWPTSRRARTTRAALALAYNKPLEAVELLAKTPELDRYPRGLAVRGQARLAAGDLEGAKTDFDKALEKASKLEPAVIGRAWIELAANDVDGARKRIEPRYNAAGSSVPLTTVYAAILRASPDPEDKKKALAILDKVVAGPRSIAGGRAQLELARLQRDLGDMRAARRAYEEAALSGSWDARIETGQLMIEDSDPIGGRDTLNAVVKDAGANATPQLLLEAARARMIAGDNPGAAELLEQLDKQNGFERWRYDRERGRLALRRGDYPGAAERLGRALDTCGDDAETFLLAAEVAGADMKQSRLVDKLRQLAPKRLRKRPEALVITGKLALAEDNSDVAEKAYKDARAALEAEKASPRRRAQAIFGYGVALYHKNEDMLAQSQLQLVIEHDPSLYAAQLYLAELIKDREPRQAFALTQKAVQFNADDVEAWKLYGTLAARLRKRAELEAAITQVGKLAPASEALRQLQSLR